MPWKPARRTWEGLDELPLGWCSPHFTSRELGGRVDPQLVLALERLRAIRGGAPCRVVSGRRSPAQNRAVGGADRSQHLYGRAADLEYGYATVSQAERAGFTGIGRRGPWAVHVDVRDGPPARWAY